MEAMKESALTGFYLIVCISCIGMAEPCRTFMSVSLISLLSVCCNRNHERCYNGSLHLEELHASLSLPINIHYSYT